MYPIRAEPECNERHVKCSRLHTLDAMPRGPIFTAVLQSMKLGYVPSRTYDNLCGLGRVPIVRATHQRRTNKTVLTNVSSVFT